MTTTNTTLTFDIGVDLDGCIHDFWTGDPLPHSLEGLRHLAEGGHRLHVITDRSPRGAVDEERNATHHWLATHQVPHDTITFAADKTVIRDLAVSERIFFIEDRAENFLALRDAGVDAYLVDQPWNHHVDTEFRVANLVEFAQIVEAAARS